MTGTIFLALNLAAALAAVLCFAATSERVNNYGRYLGALGASAAIAASIYLMSSILFDDFSLAYVASYSSIELPLIYKISAFWAGQQGSFLLWLLIHSVVAMPLMLKRRLAPAGLSAYMGLEALLAILVLAKSPFVPLDTLVENGVGMNPLLQDPWMAIHPPIVFVGYALFAVPLVYSAAALITLQEPREWLESARRWALAAWAFLGAGIFIGGYWAYKVLGWGGFWGWDPVENASLVPWLVGGIFIHVLRVARVRRAALSMVHLAAIFTFAFVLYGTFLTRSGILGDFSVHSFSGDSIGMTIAVVNALVLIAGLILLVVRAGKLPQGEMYPGYASREFLVLLGSLLLVFMAAIIFLGMSMPLLSQLVGKSAAVDTAFYVRTTMPLAVVMLLVIACALLRRYGEDRVAVGSIPAIVGFVVGAGLAFAVGLREVLPLLLAGAAGGALVATLLSYRVHAIGAGGMVAHVGLALGLLAIVLAGSGSQSSTAQLTVGEPVAAYGHEVVYLGQEYADDNLSKEYIFTVDGREVRALTKLRASGEDAAREPAIAKSIAGDLYIAPSHSHDDGRIEQIFTVNKMEQDERYAYRYEGVKFEPQPDGRTLVTADIAITDGDRVEHAQPTILATKDGGTSQPIDIMDGAARIRLTGVNGDHSQIRVEILQSLADETGAPIAASISDKPFIWLLWLGSALVCAGTLLAIKR